MHDRKPNLLTEVPSFFNKQKEKKFMSRRVTISPRRPTFSQNRLLGSLSKGLCHQKPRLILRYYMKCCFSVLNAMRP